MPSRSRSRLRALPVCFVVAPFLAVSVSSVLPCSLSRVAYVWTARCLRFCFARGPALGRPPLPCVSITVVVLALRLFYSYLRADRVCTSPPSPASPASPASFVCPRHQTCSNRLHHWCLFVSRVRAWSPQPVSPASPASLPRADVAHVGLNLKTQNFADKPSPKT